MASEDPTTRAADLAELILDEVSSVDQNWRVVARCARELAELADRAAPPSGAGGSPSPTGQ